MSLRIKYSTTNNAFNLYDYSNPAQEQFNSLLICKSTVVLRNQTTNELKAEQSITKKDRQLFQFTPLVNIEKIKNRFVIVNSNNQEDLCLVVANSLTNCSTKLKEGSIIKLGKSLIQINELVYDKTKRKTKKTFYEDSLHLNLQQKNRINYQFYEDSGKASTIDEAPFCRYCYQKSIQENNNLRVLCKCQGSTKYVHQNCLRAWVCQKSNYKQTGPSIYAAEMQGLKCEICSAMFQIKQILPCFTPQKTQYLIITIQVDKIKSIRIIFFQSDKKHQILIGRLEQNDISISDISVSRQHCRLLWDYQTGILSIEDLGSKFGTLLRKQGAQIKVPTLMQRGKTKFLFSLEENETFITRKIKSFFNIMKYEIS